MYGRPPSIWLIGWLFILVGCVSVVRGLWALRGPAGARWSAELHDHPGDFVLVTLSALLAGIGGAFVLRGHGWARWLLAVWMILHVLISLLHSTTELVLHCAVFAPILYLLFRPAATAFFRGNR